MPSPSNLPLSFNRDRAVRQLDARLEELLEKLKKYRPSEDPWIVRRAYEIASERHHDQFRSSGEPYLSHLLEVAHILADMRMDAITLTAAILHDAIEDTQYPVSRIEERFGPEVAHLVEGVTKIGRLNITAPEARQAENVRKMLLAMVTDVRVVLVKLADRLHNMRTLQYLEPDKQQRISRETLDIYAPIAHRLGMSVVRGELEDLSFRYLEPEAFFALQKEISDKAGFHKEFLDEVQATIRSKLVEAGIPAELEARVKTLYSLHRKMLRQESGLEQVYDLLAVRVVTDLERNCYAALGNRIVMRCWGCCTRRGGRYRDASRITSRFRGPICISRCTPPFCTAGNLLKCKFARRICIASRKKVWRRTGNTRPASLAHRMTISAFPGCASSSSGRRRCRNQASFFPP